MCFRVFWQVPLVEGSDFGQFISRVRRRLNLPDSGTVTLHSDDGKPVDSIESLLEVDESSPLTVTSDARSSAAGGDHAIPGSRLRGAASKGPNSPGPGIAGASDGASASASASASCRVDIPVSEWARGGRGGDQEETGALKYRKRRGLAINLRRLRRPILLVALLVGGSLVGLRVLLSRA